MEKEIGMNDQVIHIFNTWNNYHIKHHKYMTARMKRYINDALTKNSMQEICNSIINYSKILHDSQAWYKFKYSLDDFLLKKYDWFLDSNAPMERFYNRGRPDMVGASIPPDTSTIPPDINMDAFKEKFKQWKAKKKEQE